MEFGHNSSQVASKEENCLITHSNVLCYRGRKFNMVELLKRAKSPSGKKRSQRFIDSSINEWCRGLECVMKNDCGHVEHCYLASITAFIKHTIAYEPLTSVNQIAASILAVVCVLLECGYKIKVRWQA